MYVERLGLEPSSVGDTQTPVKRATVLVHWVTKPCEFIGFGAMEVPKPYRFIGFGAMEV